MTVQFVPVEQLVLRHKPSTSSVRPRYCSLTRHCSRKFLQASCRLILVVSSKVVMNLVLSCYYCVHWKSLHSFVKSYFGVAFPSLNRLFHKPYFFLKKIHFIKLRALYNSVYQRWYHRVANCEVREPNNLLLLRSYRKEDSRCLVMWSEWTSRQMPGEF